MQFACAILSNANDNYTLGWVLILGIAVLAPGIPVIKTRLHAWQCMVWSNLCVKGQD